MYLRRLVLQWFPFAELQVFEKEVDGVLRFYYFIIAERHPRGKDLAYFKRAQKWMKTISDGSSELNYLLEPIT
jgi:hypothetical protein